MSEISIVRIERLELSFAPRPWPFAMENRDEIERHFAELQRTKPAIWNGRILLLCEHSIAGTVFRGRCFETDFANFVAWRAWDFPDPAVKNCFAIGALRGSDGGFLLGVMGAHTLNAGVIYFPGGLVDPGDIVGQTVDLAGNVWRELKEETDRDAYEADGHHVVGLAFTRKVVRNLANDGFEHASTIHRELMNLNNGRTSWDQKTVVMVDEAGMVDTKLMAMVTAHAADAGAKLILVGDSRQLSSIDRGGMYSILKDRHGAAVLSEVRRQYKADERRASEMMHEGNFDAALKDFNAILALNPNNVRAHTGRGQLFAKRRDLEQARADYRSAAFALLPFDEMDTSIARATARAPAGRGHRGDPDRALDGRPTYKGATARESLGSETLAAVPVA